GLIRFRRQVVRHEPVCSPYNGGIREAKEGLDMSDLGERTFGSRAFVRLGVAAGGVGLLAACGPGPAVGAAARAPPARAPPRPATAAAAPPPRAHTPSAPPTPPRPPNPPAAAAQAPAAPSKVSTLKLLGWNYEPPLVQENLDRFEQQNPNYKVEYEPIAG